MRQKRTLERLLTSGGRLNFVCGVGRLLERLLRCVGALRRLSVFSLKISQIALKKFLFIFFRAYGANIVITIHYFVHNAKKRTSFFFTFFEFRKLKAMCAPFGAPFS